MKLKTPLRLASALPLATLTFFTTAEAHAQGPLVTGLDHIPVVVRDLDRAQADFRAMGFSIKPEDSTPMAYRMRTSNSLTARRSN